MENNFVLDPDVNWLGMCLVCLSVFNLIMYRFPWERYLTNTARGTSLGAACL